MMRSRKLLARLLFIMMIFQIIVQLAQATTTNFTVKGGEEVTKTLNLAVEDHVLIKFTIVAQSDKTLRFYITYPNGTVTDFGKRAVFSHSFVCDAEGNYVLHFSNTESPEDKFVTLNYEIEHYIFGIPQMLFLTIIIVLVCLAAVTAFVLMGKPR